MEKIVFIIILFISSFTYSQEMKSYPINYYEEIGEYDVSKLLLCDSIILEHEEKIKRLRPQPIGFIGKDYQRFYIHFLSISKIPKNKYEYLVKGKTRVKENICDFEGIINVKESRIGNIIWILDSIDKFNTGYIKGSYKFKENADSYHSGILEGVFHIKFYFDNQGRIQYNGLKIYSDNFANNQFYGFWTSYDKKIKMECNWGDFRIPNSIELDIGVGEFSQDEKHIKNGWGNYDVEEKEWWLEQEKLN